MTIALHFIKNIGKAKFENMLLFIIVKVRRCKEEDLEEVYKIECASFKFPYPSKFFYDYLDKLFFVLEKNGRIVGYVIADEKRNIIMSIAIHPEYRRKGYGRTLLEHVLRLLKGEVILQVRKSNVGAIKFYEKLGFKKKEEIKNYYIDGEDAFLMSKKLN